MKRLLFSCILICSAPLLASAQLDTLSLNQCFQQLSSHYPLGEQKGMYRQSADIAIKKINTQYLPQLGLNAQATYVSDVAHIPIEVPFIKIPTPSKDQYKATIDLNQLIYDGGAIRHQRNVQTATELAQEQNVEIQLYQLKQQVSDLYFSVLLADEQAKVLDLMRSNLEVQLKKLQSGIKNGVALPMNADQLEVEIIQLDQQKTALQQNKHSAMSILAEITGLGIDTGTRFNMPKAALDTSMSLDKRPEYKYFQLQQQSIEEQRKAIDARTMPKVYGFAQAGYGRPGLNPLDNEFKSFWMAGVKLSWTPWQWHANEYDKSLLQINKDMVANQQKVFDINTRTQLLRQQAGIQNLQDQLKKDDEIIGLREKISKTSASQLQNGISTLSDYLIQLHAEQKARLDQKRHLVELLQAETTYSIIQGNQ